MLRLKFTEEVNYYKILGINLDSSLKVIKKKYRKLAIKYHPDKGGDEEKFKLINESYQILSDHKSEYDTFLEGLIKKQTIEPPKAPTESTQPNPKSNNTKKDKHSFEPDPITVKGKKKEFPNIWGDSNYYREIISHDDEQYYYDSNNFEEVWERRVQDIMNGYDRVKKMKHHKRMQELQKIAQHQEKIKRMQIESQRRKMMEEEKIRREKIRRIQNDPNAPLWSDFNEYLNPRFIDDYYL